MKNDQKFVGNLVRVVKRNYTNSHFDVSSMAGQMKISDRQLQRKVRALTGRSPMQYLRDFRLERSLQYLQDGAAVGEAAKAVGFSSHAYFTCCFKVKFRITPKRLQTDRGRTVGIDGSARKRRDASQRQ